MSTIKTGTTLTTAYQVVGDTTGALVIQTGSTPTTAVTIGADQSVTFAGAVNTTGNQTVTGNLAVTGSLTTTGYANLPNTFGFKNRIINGAMMIDQRNAGASVTATASITYALDRWYIYGTQSSKFTVQQNAGSVTPPAGFTNYLGCTSSSAYSVPSNESYRFHQGIEGFNVADLGWGTANAQPVTLSFWVRSSLTGTFGGSVYNGDATRTNVFSFTVSSANTWEYKTVTIAGDTSGTWNKTNDAGLRVQWSLGAGSTYLGTAGVWGSTLLLGVTGQVNMVSTSGATFYITGVQLEKGSTATSFDYRPYTTELQLCQRYFQTSYADGTAVGTITASYAVGRYIDAVTPSNYCGCPYSYPVRMRIAPTVTIYGVLSGATSGQVSGDTTNKTGAVFQSGFWGFNAGCNNVASTNAESVRYHFASTAEL